MAETKLMEGDWVVVADGEKALFLENRGMSDDIQLAVVRKREQDNPPNREQTTDKAGRGQDGGRQQMSGFEETDFHELQKERFGDQLAERLYKLAHQNAFKRLVLIAQPNVLGEIRKTMHKELQSRLVAEIPQTLTNHTIDQIERQVADKLAESD